MYTQVEQCRICGNTNLTLVLDLGNQMLTGVFPKAAEEQVTTGPLHLVRCTGDPSVCGLLQLGHTYDVAEMYGDNYGYRSGLNASMVAHLNRKIERILSSIVVTDDDLVVDIGSNDSTTLRAYPSGPTLVGFDPTGAKFRDYYPPHVQLVADFFSARTFTERYPGRKAKIVTSFSMFYDLPNPEQFMREIVDVLADDGMWVFEQSYMPTMLDMNSYDTVCHEHLEFYGLRQIKWMTDRVGLEIVDVEFNDINGGSFSVTAIKSRGVTSVAPSVQMILDDERARGLHTDAPYTAFAARVVASRRDFREFLATAKGEGKTIVALGASTKGNVLLQYCGVTTDDISCVGEVNADKFGCFTPGTFIPIVAESVALSRRPDYVVVLPWHFRAFFEANQTLRQTSLVFPLPSLSVRAPLVQEPVSG